MIYSLLTFLISILLYVFAPATYSYSYCIILLIVYLISSVWIIRHTLINRNYFNFHVLFLISFFFVNFVYPVFLYPDSPYHFSVFKLRFDHNLITKATALALVGSCSYNLGVSLRLRKVNTSLNPPDTNLNTIQFLLINWLYLVFIVLLIFAGKEMLKGNFGSSSNIPAGLLVIFQVSVGLSVILMVFSKSFTGKIIDFIWKFNKPILVVLLLYILLFIYTGDRGPVIQIVLITIGAFAVFVRPMKLKGFVVIILAGMLVLTFISFARSKNVAETEKGGVSGYVERGLSNIKIESFLDMGMDLIVCNRNLYAGYEYANANGLNYGKSMFYYAFSPFPFLPSLTTQLFFNSAPADLTTASIITKDVNSTYGLGTNIISDLYMAFGTLGVVFFMFILGLVVTIFERKAFGGANFNYCIATLFMLSFSVYLPRTSVLYPIRHIIWAIILFELLKLVRILLLQLSKKFVNQ